MRRATAELIVKDPNKFAHHDRVFLNNPVVMQGMGLAMYVPKRPPNTVFGSAFASSSYLAYSALSASVLIG